MTTLALISDYTTGIEDCFVGHFGKPVAPILGYLALVSGYYRGCSSMLFWSFGFLGRAFRGWTGF